jgi:hypothetical protein
MKRAPVGRTPRSAADAHVGLLIRRSKCGSWGTRADQGVRPISAKIKTSAVENVPESDLWAGDWTPKTGPCGLNLALMGVRPTIL